MDISTKSYSSSAPLNSERQKLNFWNSKVRNSL